MFELKSSEDKHFYFGTLHTTQEGSGWWLDPDKAGRDLAFILASVQTRRWLLISYRSTTLNHNYRNNSMRHADREMGNILRYKII